MPETITNKEYIAKERASIKAQITKLEAKDRGLEEYAATVGNVTTPHDFTISGTIITYRANNAADCDAIGATLSEKNVDWLRRQYAEGLRWTGLLGVHIIRIYDRSKPYDGWD